MKKAVLSLTVVATMFISCKETAENTETAIDSTTTEVTETIETVTDSSTTTIDSTTTKAEGTVKVELKKAEEVIKK